jgi:hypothetical protein
MYQRAEEHPEPERERPIVPEPRDERPESTADFANASHGPVIEPSGEPRSNVTPITARGERPANPPTPAPGVETTQPTPEGQHSQLFAHDEGERFRSDWHGVQAGFVDDPRHAIEEADRLVTRTIMRLTELFDGERTKLKEQWSRGDNVSTEDLRLSLQRYHAYFDRLLSL